MDKERISSGNIVDFKVLKRILQFVQPYKGRFYFLIVLTILLGVLAPVRPLLVQYTLDHHVAYNDYAGMVKVMFLILALLILYFILQYLHTYISGHVGQYVVRDLRIKLYKHLVQFKLAFFDKTPIGRLVTRTISDVEALAEVFSEGLAALVADLLQVVFIFLFMLITDWRLALVSISTIPLMLLSTYIFKEKIKVSFNDVRNAISNLNSFVQEHLTGMTIVQIFGSEQREMKKFTEINKEHRTAHLKSVLYYSIYFPVAEIIAATGIGLLVWYGAKGVIKPNMGITLGTLTAFIMYIQMFFRPIRMIADRYNTLQMGVVSSSRIIRLLDDNEHLMKEGALTLHETRGKVEFKNVWFAYNDAKYVLKDITFLVQPGEKIAFVGATGAGKSSIINLLNRFYEINRGTIKIDDIDVRDIAISSLREKIGIVLQDVFLFSDTIRYNIALGDSNVTDKMIRDAADLVGASKFIDRMPGGLDYNVRERGATLSTGQRQLISFIRAMVYDPKILILDEATNSVDQETEGMIQKAIEKMMKKRTSIIIAHRLATIQKADKIIALDKGEIREIGLHEELLSQNGYYAQLHKMQYKEVT